MKQMKVVFYIPKEPVEDADSLRSVVLDNYGGFTECDGVGAWRNNDGTVFREIVSIITVFCEDTDAIRAEIRDIAETYMEDAQQECVLYEINSEPFFIDFWEDA